MMSSMSMAQTWERPLVDHKEANPMEWYFSKDEKLIMINGPESEMKAYATKFVESYLGDFSTPDFSSGTYVSWNLSNEDGADMKISYVVLEGKGILSVKND